MNSPIGWLVLGGIAQAVGAPKPIYWLAYGGAALNLAYNLATPSTSANSA